MNRLTYIFGPEIDGLPENEAARLSTEKYVRSEGGLALYEEWRNPTGHILTAWEAYTTFGLNVLEEAVDRGTAILRESANATSDAFRKRLDNLELLRDSVARAARVDEADVVLAETTPSQLSIHKLERIAFALGLDERFLAFKKDAGGDNRLAYRLRTLQARPVERSTAINAGTALLFAEAASIIRVQHRLQKWLGLQSEIGGFHPSDDYGSVQNPAWRIGYNLAEDARRILGLGDAPIPSMRELVEEQLDIPVIQARLPNRIAGATVITTDESGEAARGVVLNTVGDNQNVWIRRVTLAHELGHLLYDLDDRLERVRVDSYENNQADAQADTTDYIEQRANAFAVAFLAPNDAVRQVAPTPVSEESVAGVMDTFGISHTSARYHIANCHYQNYHVPSVGVGLMPTHEWLAAEDFSLDYFPIPSAPYQRRGRFAGIVAAACGEGLITDHTAALYLGCDKEIVGEHIANLRSLHGV